MGIVVMKLVRIRRVNIIEDLSGSEKYIERVNRLFNRNYFQYEGIIHEQILALDGQTYLTEIIDITAQHVGYKKEVLNRIDKRHNSQLAMIETKLSNPDLNLKLYMLYRKLVDNKITAEEALKGYEIYLNL